MGGNLARFTGMGDAKAKARKVPVVAETADDIAQAVVAPVPAALLEAGDTDGQVEVVVRDENVLRRDLVETRQCGHGLAAVVHEGIGLEEPDVLPRQPHARYLAVELLFTPEAAAMDARHLVNKPEPGIVPGSSIFRAGITQAHQQLDT